MRFWLTEAEKERVRQGYRKYYAQGMRSRPEPFDWEYGAIAIGLFLSGLWRSLRRFFGYHNIDLY